MPAAAPRMSRQGTYNVALMTYNVPVENLNVGVSASDASGVSHPVGLAILGRTPIDESGRVTRFGLRRLAAAFLTCLVIAWGETPAPKSPPSDVVLITIDTWRADAAGFAGNRADCP